MANDDGRDQMTAPAVATTAPAAGWHPERPKFRPLHVLRTWLFSALALLIAAGLLPGAEVNGLAGAMVAAAVIAVLNAILPPLVAALRLPFMLVLGFLIVLVLDAWMLLVADDLTDGDLSVDGFWWALLVALVAAAVTLVLEVRGGVERRQRVLVPRHPADRPAHRGADADRRPRGHLPRDRRARAPHPPARDAGRQRPQHGALDRRGRVPASTGWETDLSSQTGASQAGILLGSNENIPAFRWVEKANGRVMTCSAPADCAEIERRHATDKGLLLNGGASRGNLLSGQADEVILTVSRIEAEKKANPGYRAFFANGFNVTRVLVLVFWEVILEWTAALRAARRDVRPRGHRGGAYPFMRAGMCIAVRDLIVQSVLTDMMKGRPAVYATFSSYDEVAHHSGLERADTLEALRKLDQQFGRIEKARRFAPRPYEIVVLSDHGQTQGATFKQRNGYGLDELVRALARGGRRHLAHERRRERPGRRSRLRRGDGPRREGGEAREERRDRGGRRRARIGQPGSRVPDGRAAPHDDGGDRAAPPTAAPGAGGHPHVGWLLVRSSERGPVAIGASGSHHLSEGRVEGDDPLAHFSPNAPAHLLRTDGFADVADIMVGSFYDPDVDEGCAFEELISFHGGLGGPQTEPFVLHPARLRAPDEPIVGAASVNALLRGWRTELEDSRPDSATEAVSG